MSKPDGLTHKSILRGDGPRPLEWVITIIMDTNTSQETVMILPSPRIDERYGRYRLITPKADQMMHASMERYGQLSPVIVGRPIEEHYPLVDGFKRFRAGQRLGYTSFKASVLDVGQRALMAAMIHLNRKARSMGDLEEAMIVHALHREDRLSQVEISELLGFHKSWVCRRIAMVERLDEEVLERVRLGLVGPAVCRELTRLPRGNQPKALDAVLAHGLTCREAGRLVSLLQSSPKPEHESILRFPESILAARQPNRPPAKDRNTPFSICNELAKLEKLCLALFLRLQEPPPLPTPAAERRHALTLVRSIEIKLGALRGLPPFTEIDNDPVYKEP